MNKLKIVFAVFAMLLSLAMTSSARAGITMTCFSPANVPGYTPKTATCLMAWLTADEVEYPTGEIDYHLAYLGSPTSTVEDTFLFTASTMPNNRLYGYIDYTAPGSTGAGLYFFSQKGTLLEQMIDETGIWWRWHPDTYKSDSITATMPP